MFLDQVGEPEKGKLVSIGLDVPEAAPSGLTPGGADSGTFEERRASEARDASGTHTSPSAATSSRRLSAPPSMPWPTRSRNGRSPIWDAGCKSRRPRRARRRRLARSRLSPVCPKRSGRFKGGRPTRWAPSSRWRPWKATMTTRSNFPRPQPSRQRAACCTTSKWANKKR